MKIKRLLRSDHIDEDIREVVFWLEIEGNDLVLKCANDVVLLKINYDGTFSLVKNCIKSGLDATGPDDTIRMADPVSRY